MNRELPDVQAGFRKGQGTRDQIANICWISKKAREFQKNIYFCFIDYAKAFDCVDHNKLWNNAIAEMKSTLEGNNSRIMEAEDRISEVDDGMVEINEAERKKEKRMKRN